MKSLITSWKNSELPPADPEELERFARRAAELARLPDFGWNMAVEFTGDPLMIRRNRELLGHEGTTDVITFPYFSGNEDDRLLENEVAVDAVVNLDAALREGRKLQRHARGNRVRHQFGPCRGFGQPASAQGLPDG